MRASCSIIVALSVLFAPVAPVLGLDRFQINPPSAPASAEQEHPSKPGDSSKDDDPSSSPDAPPSLGLTPRVDTFESLECSLRTPLDGRSTHRLDSLYPNHVRYQPRPKRLDRIQRQVRCNSVTLRIVANGLRSHAPPIA